MSIGKPLVVIPRQREAGSMEYSKRQPSSLPETSARHLLCMVLATLAWGQPSARMTFDSRIIGIGIIFYFRIGASRVPSSTLHLLPCTFVPECTSRDRTPSLRDNRQVSVHLLRLCSFLNLSSLLSLISPPNPPIIIPCEVSALSGALRFRRLLLDANPPWTSMPYFQFC